MSDPTFTRTDQFGHLRADWPDPPSPFYPVSHEALVEYVAFHNRVADLREHLAMGQEYAPKILAILDGDE